VILRVDPASPVPPYEQVRSQVHEAVEHGALVPGDRLPTVRRLAADLGVAPGTVARAYRELEAQGVVEGRGRNGTVVAPRGEGTERRAQELTVEYLHGLARLGLGPTDGHRLLTELGGDRPAVPPQPTG
jgi:DNA-binding transcriptional regulator YhcF (GntR family)